ncbi:NADPH-dependent F420 reductase (plasmid) [Sphaerimonospora sp. CA-214678]|uniref:NADPH-dependent F420 reductase n=1 Tax=Sphaerimonospora sp. CA-214678 TaxID=3240029 RepID=UPI003D8D12CB
MNVGILGAGPFGLALAARLARHRVDVRVTTRDVAKAAERARGYPALAEVPELITDMATVLGESDLLVLALPYPVALRLSQRFPAFAAGRSLVDVTNPLLLRDRGDPFAAGDGCLGIARALPYTRIAKAFNTFTAARMDTDASDVAPYATDDDSVADTIEDLARRIGLRPVRIGPLAYASHLESAALVHQLTSGALS